MRKLFRAFLLAAVLVTALCVGAMAADEPTVAGLYGFDSAGGAVSIVPFTASDTTAIAASNQGAGYETFYEDAARFDVTYNNAALEADEQCLLLVCSGEGAPGADNIVYINQEAAAAGSVSFENAYPSSLAKGDYRIYIVSKNSAYVQAAPAATFSYQVPYTLGDCDGIAGVDVRDALAVLSHIVGNSTLTGSNYLAADVAAPKNTIDISDALRILAKVVGNIESFED